MTPIAQRPYRGVFPVAPTIFDDRGELDLAGQRRCIDFMIEAGSNGLCILANFSEQFVLTDAEREQVMHAVLQHVAGRVPVIVTTTHFGSRICAGTPLSVDLLARMAREIHNIRYFKIEVPMAAAKLRNLVAAGGDSIEGPWDGEEGITLLADLDAGATGAMTGGGYPDGMRQIVDPYLAGRREEAMAAYARWLPLINYENRQCGLQAAKILMQEGGVIGSEAVRHPLQKVHPAARAGLIEIARQLDPVVLRWGR